MSSLRTSFNNDMEKEIEKIIPDTLSNADLEYLEIQRSKMETDIFPLDTLLPISSVLKFFRDEYNNVVAHKPRHICRV